MSDKSEQFDGTELRGHLRETLVHLEDLLGKLPSPLSAGLKERIAELRRLVVDHRPPRLAVVGRRGSGKSSLINALFGEAVAEVGHEKAQTGEAGWFEFGGERGALSILDTRGFQEGSAPTAPDAAKSPIDSIRRALRTKSPDALLFLIRAADVDAAVDEDIRLLAQVSGEADARHGGKTPILAVVTHCDQVEPKNAHLHEDPRESPRDPQDVQDVAEKVARVERIKRLLDTKLQAVPDLRDRLVAVLGVSTYQSWRQDGTRRADERWQIDELVRFLFEELPREARVELARLAKTRRIQRDLANTLTYSMASVCAAIAATPIPLADLLPITTAQVSLVVSIGYVSGRNLSMKAAAEFLAALGANVGAAFALREAARAIIKVIVPMGAPFVSGAIAYAGTVGIGKAATAYFVDGASKADLKKVFDEAKAQAKSDAEKEVSPKDAPKDAKENASAPEAEKGAAR
jgi:predicted GTPase